MRRNRSSLMAAMLVVGALTVTAYANSATTERTALIYENNSVSVYRLPQKGAIEEISEKVASFVVQQIAQKGFTNILTAATSTLISKLGGFFLTFISQSKEVGIQTIVDMAVLAEDELTDTIEVNGDFLPLIMVTAGDCFDYGVLLAFQYGTESFRTELELLEFDELSGLYQEGLLEYGDRFLVIPKEPLDLPTPGTYRLLATAWCESEGNRSRTLRVVEVLNEQTAAITLTVTPSVFYIDVGVETTLTLRESNGIGVNLNHIKGVHYDTQGNLVFENEASGEGARQLFDEDFGTHYLPPHETLQMTSETTTLDSQTPGRMVMTIGGTDDNGNFVSASFESEIRP